jgi:hypothetical protein
MTQFSIFTVRLRYYERGREYVRPLHGLARRFIRGLQPYQTGDPRDYPFRDLWRYVGEIIDWFEPVLR